MGWEGRDGDKRTSGDLSGQTGLGAAPGLPLMHLGRPAGQGRAWGWVKGWIFPGVRRPGAEPCCDLTSCGLEKTWILPFWRRLTESWPSVTYAWW